MSADAIYNGFIDELEKVGYAGAYYAARAASQKSPAKPASAPSPSKLQAAGKLGRRLAIGAGAIGVGSYALGRGLQAGVRDRQQKEREEANRSAQLSGSPAPY